MHFPKYLASFPEISIRILRNPRRTRYVLILATAEQSLVPADETHSRLAEIRTAEQIIADLEDAYDEFVADVRRSAGRNSETAMEFLHPFQQTAQALRGEVSKASGNLHSDRQYTEHMQNAMAAAVGIATVIEAPEISDRAFDLHFSVPDDRVAKEVITTDVDDNGRVTLTDEYATKTVTLVILTENDQNNSDNERGFHSPY